MNLFNPPYDIYTISAGFVLALSVIEIILFTLGASFSKLFNHDADNDFSHDHQYDFDTVNLFNFGKVPFFLILVCLAGFFGFSGIGIHLILSKLGMTASNLYVLPVSVLSSALFTFGITSLWSRLFPNEETYAISEKEYIGAIGTVQLGTGDNKNAVEVSTYDKHGVKHFIMAHVALPDIQIKEGDRVTIVARDKDKHFLVLPESTIEKESYM